MKKILALIITLSIIVCTLCGCVQTYTPQPQIPPKSDEYDDVLCSGDGYHIVIKHVEDSRASYDMLGVVNDNGEWIQNLSKSHPFLKDGKVMSAVQFGASFNYSGHTEAPDARRNSELQIIRKCIVYCGEGMFALCTRGMGALDTSPYSNSSEKRYIVYNAETGKGGDIGFCMGQLLYHNGNMKIKDGGFLQNTKIVDKDGNVTFIDD